MANSVVTDELLDLAKQVLGTHQGKDVTKLREEFDNNYEGELTTLLGLGLC